MVKIESKNVILKRKIDLTNISFAIMSNKSHFCSILVRTSPPVRFPFEQPPFVAISHQTWWETFREDAETLPSSREISVSCVTELQTKLLFLKWQNVYLASLVVFYWWLNWPVNFCSLILFFDASLSFAFRIPCLSSLLYMFLMLLYISSSA